MWWWDLKLGWVWTSCDRYPWVWMQGEERWLLYLEGTRRPRLFWDAAVGDWRED